MTNVIQITEDEFDANYPLLPNHLNPNASWGSSEEGGCLFETYGDELQFVLAQDSKTIWTLMDGDDGSLVLVSGYHVVNRIGYLISTISVPDNSIVECVIPQDED